MACAMSRSAFSAGWPQKFGVDAGRVRLDHAGLNHLSWIRQVLIDGVDRLPELLGDDDVSELSARPSSRRTAPNSRRDPVVLPALLLLHRPGGREQRTGPRRAEEVLAIEQTLLEMYADPALDHKPELLEKRGGAYYSEAAAALVTSLLTGDGAHHYVDVRNNGTIAGLPDDAVVEVPALVDTPGAHPVDGGAAGARDARPGAGGDRLRDARDRGGAHR